jgi:hypothetical protein
VTIACTPEHIPQNSDGCFRGATTAKAKLISQVIFKIFATVDWRQGRKYGHYYSSSQDDYSDAAELAGCISCLHLARTFLAGLGGKDTTFRPPAACFFLASSIMARRS